MDGSEREDLANKSWKIEEYHRTIKTIMCCGKVPGKKKRITESTFNVIIESFSKVGSTKVRNGISLFESKTKIRRVASTIYLSKPRYNLNLE